MAEINLESGRPDMEQRNQQATPQAASGIGGTVTPGLIFGLAIVAIGVVFLLGNFGFPVDRYWHFWPLVLVAVGLAKIIDSRDTPGRTWGAILIIAGVVLVGERIYIPFLNVNLWQLWPLALIAFGGIMLWGAL